MGFCKNFLFHGIAIEPLADKAEIVAGFIYGSDDKILLQFRKSCIEFVFTDVKKVF